MKKNQNEQMSLVGSNAEEKKETATQANPYMQPGTTQTNPYAQQGTYQTNPYMQAGVDQANPYAQQGTYQANPYAQQGTYQANPYMQQGAGQANPYMQAGVYQANPYMQQGVGQVNPYMQPGAYQANPYIQQGAGQVNPYAQPVLQLDPGTFMQNPQAENQKASQDIIDLEKSEEGTNAAKQQDDSVAQQSANAINVGVQEQQISPFMQMPYQMNQFGGGVEQDTFEQIPLTTVNNPQIPNQNVDNQQVEKDKKKNGKKGILIGCIAGGVVLLVIVFMIIIITISHHDTGRLAKKQLDFVYQDGVTASDYVEAYYGGVQAQMENDAVVAYYDDLIANKDSYLKKVVRYTGTIVEEDAANHYIYLEEEAGKRVVFFDARDRKDLLAVGSRVEMYATFYDVIVNADGNQRPCCILWSANLIESDVVVETIEEGLNDAGDIVDENVEEVPDMGAEVSGGVSDDFPQFDYPSGSEEAAVIENMSCSESMTDSKLFLLFTPQSEAFEAYAKVNCYVAFMDEEGNVISVESDASNVYPGQQATIMGFDIQEEIADYEVSLEVTMLGEPEYTFDDVIVECEVVGEQVNYEIANLTTEEIYYEGIVVYVNGEDIVDYTWIAEYVPAEESVSGSVGGYAGECDSYALIHNNIM